MPRRGPDCNRDRVVATVGQPKDISAAWCDATSPAGATAKSATRSCSTAPPTAAAYKNPSFLRIKTSRNEFDCPPAARRRPLNFAPAVKPDPEGPSDGMLPEKRGTGAALALPLGLRGVGLTPPRRGPDCNRDRLRGPARLTNPSARSGRWSGRNIRNLAFRRRKVHGTGRARRAEVAAGGRAPRDPAVSLSLLPLGDAGWLSASFALDRMRLGPRAPSRDWPGSATRADPTRSRATRSPPRFLA